MRALTTTSYAILGLLGVRPFSAYELARQMERSFRFIWPRARSAIYEEPKNLVARGLASVRDEPAGPTRTRAVYSITPAGRRAMRRWLREPSAPPQFECEAAVRTMFAEQAGLADLRTTVEQLAAQAAEAQAALLAVGERWLEDAPYPERIHVSGVVGRLAHEQAAALQRWAAWALEELESWDDTGSATAARRGRAIVTSNLRTFGPLVRRRPA